MDQVHVPSTETYKRINTSPELSITATEVEDCCNSALFVCNNGPVLL